MPTDPSFTGEPMTITENIVRDLLPLYFEGEGSADTRNLVESWFARHPAFAQAAKKGSSALDALAGLAAPPLDPAGAKAALKRVHRILLLRELSHGLAMAFTVCPIFVLGFALLFPSQTPALLRDKLALCVGLFLLLAAPTWAICLYIRRKVRTDIFG